MAPALTEFFTGPLKDLIPDEILNDGFKFCTWTGLWMAFFTMLCGTTKKYNEEGEPIGPESNNNIMDGIETLLTYTSPAFAAGNWWKNRKEEETSVTGAIINTVFIPPNWNNIKSKYKKGSVQYGVIEMAEDDFTRNAIIAAAAASMGTYTVYETDFMEKIPGAVPDVIDIGV